MAVCAAFLLIMVAPSGRVSEELGGVRGCYFDALEKIVNKLAKRPRTKEKVNIGVGEGLNIIR